MKGIEQVQESWRHRICQHFISGIGFTFSPYEFEDDYTLETSNWPWKMIFEFDSASFERMVPCQGRGDTLEVSGSI